MADRSRMTRRVVLTVGLLLLAVLSVDLLAQCPMCRMAAETNLQNGGTEGRGLNKGILYMLSLPYILIGTLGFIWWRNRKKSSPDS